MKTVSVNILVSSIAFVLSLCFATDVVGQVESVADQAGTQQASAGEANGSTGTLKQAEAAGSASVSQDDGPETPIPYHDGAGLEDVNVADYGTVMILENGEILIDTVSQGSYAYVVENTAELALVRGAADGVWRIAAKDSISAEVRATLSSWVEFPDEERDGLCMSDGCRTPVVMAVGTVVYALNGSTGNGFLSVQDRNDNELLTITVGGSRKTELAGQNDCETRDCLWGDCYVNCPDNTIPSCTCHLGFSRCTCHEMRHLGLAIAELF